MPMYSKVSLLCALDIKTGSLVCTSIFDPNLQCYMIVTLLRPTQYKQYICFNCVVVLFTNLSVAPVLCICFVFPKSVCIKNIDRYKYRIVHIQYNNNLSNPKLVGWEYSNLTL